MSENVKATESNGAQQASSPLREKMSELLAQKRVTTNNTTPTSQLESMANSVTDQQDSAPQDQQATAGTPNINEALNDLMETQWFKDLPKEHKEFIMNGGNPDKLMDDLDKAVIEQQLDAVREINRVRREVEGKEEITMEEYRSGEFLEERDEENKDEENEFIKMMKELDGGEDDGDEEEAQERFFKELERRFENSIDVELTGATKEYDRSSAALRVDIKRNKSYEKSIKNILEANDIKIKTTKKGNIKRAVLKSYTQRHDHVTTPLVNSGFHITLSGASIPEIIAIASIENPKSLLELETKKLSVIKKHLVDTSFGNVPSLYDLMKVIHYKDEQTLYYNLFIATFPEENDYPFTCTNEKCGAELNLKIHGADLVLNPEEFKEDHDIILYKNMDIKDVIKHTKLSKIKQIILSDGTVVGIRIPSLYDRLMTMSKIEAWVNKYNKDTTNLNVVFGYLMFVEYIALLTEDGEHVRFDSIDDLIEILISMDSEAHNEIDMEIEKYDDSKEIEYGIKSFVCPSCKRVHKQQRQKMDDLLFTLSQVRGMRNTLERRKNREKLKSLNEEK